MRVRHNSIAAQHTYKCYRFSLVAVVSFMHCRYVFKRSSVMVALALLPCAGILVLLSIQSIRVRLSLYVRTLFSSQLIHLSRSLSHNSIAFTQTSPHAILSFPTLCKHISNSALISGTLTQNTP